MKKLILTLTLIAQLYSVDLFAQNAVSTTTTSSSFVCDGTASLDTTNVDVASIIWEEVTALPVVFAAGVGDISNLCTGNYSVTFSLNGIITTQYFTIVETNPSPCLGYALSMTTTNSMDANSCDGTATVSILNGTTPFSYWWVNIGTLTSGNLSNLCPGAYYCEVTDANGCQDVAEGIVLDSSQMTGDTIIFNNPGNCSNPIGVLSDTVENCDFDYSLVNNVYIGAIDNATNNPLDTVTVWWIFEDSTNFNFGYFVAQYTGITGVGCYAFQAVVYCYQKSTTYHQIIVHESNFVDVVQTQELSLNEKTIVRVTDIMGQDCAFESGKLRIIFYSDGSIKRTFQVE